MHYTSANECGLRGTSPAAMRKPFAHSRYKVTLGMGTRSRGRRKTHEYSTTLSRHLAGLTARGSTILAPDETIKALGAAYVVTLR